MATNPLIRAFSAEPLPIAPDRVDANKQWQFNRAVVEYLRRLQTRATESLVAETAIQGGAGGGGGGGDVLFVGGDVSAVSHTSSVPATVPVTYATVYALPASVMNATDKGIRLTLVTLDNFPQGGNEVPLRVTVGSTLVLTAVKGLVSAGQDNLSVTRITMLRKGSELRVHGETDISFGATSSTWRVRWDTLTGGPFSGTITIGTDLVIQASGTASSLMRLMVVERLVAA